MNNIQFKKIYDYLGKEDDIYIIIYKEQIKHITPIVELIVSEIQKLHTSCFLKANVSKIYGKKVCLQNIPTKGGNSYMIKKEYLLPILDILGKKLDILIEKEQIYHKSIGSIKLQQKRKYDNAIASKNKIRAYNVDFDGFTGASITPKYEKWILNTKKELTKNTTKSEDVLFKRLEKSLGKRVKKQVPFVINGKSYFADICIKSRKLIIEVDGEYHNHSKQKDKDSQRDDDFKSIGYRTLRLSNKEAINCKVAKDIIAMVKKEQRGEIL